VRFAKCLSVTLFAIVVLCTSNVRAQSLDPAFQKARALRDNALYNGDVAIYERYTTDRFIVVDPTGIRLMEEQRARVIETKQHPLGPPPPRHDEKIDVYGGMIILNWNQDAGGKPLDIMEIWIKENGTWKCAAAHASFPPIKK